MPIPQGIIRDMSPTFNRLSLLDMLPPEALQALAGFMWISGETPGYPNWVKDTTRGSLVLYYLPTLGSADPYVLLPTTTMIQLGRSAYAPARMEIVDDVINMSRLRARAESTQLAPIQTLTLRDPNPDGSGTPITAWAGRGTASGSVGDNMDTSDAGGDRYSTPSNSFTTSFYASQYPTCGGLGTSATVQSTLTARGGGGVRCKERSTLLRLLHHLHPLQYLTWGHFRPSWRRH